MYVFQLCWTLFILASAVTDYVSISQFVSLVGVSIAITSFAVWIKICVTLHESKSINEL